MPKPPTYAALTLYLPPLVLERFREQARAETGPLWARNGDPSPGRVLKRLIAEYLAGHHRTPLLLEEEPTAPKAAKRETSR
jgi:hypothetical protein